MSYGALLLFSAALAQHFDASLPVLNDGAGILNGRFLYWVDGEPLHWDLTGGREPYVSKAVRLDRSGSAELIAGAQYSYVQITQRIEADKPLGGFTIVFSAESYATEPNTAKLIVRLQDGTKFHSDPHSGAAQWERLVVNASIPAGYEADFVYVALHHYNTPAAPAKFRDARVLCEATDAP